MTSKIAQPYGGWPSPVTPELITAGSVARDYPCQVDGVSYWQETRPDEAGRTTVVARRADGSLVDLLPFPHSTRSKVHEYGGRCWLVADHSLFFVAAEDQRVYRLPLPAGHPADTAFAPQPLTPERPGLRFADFCHHPTAGLLIAVCEDHGAAGDEPSNTLVAIPVDGSGCRGGELRTLVANADFVAYPRLSPDLRSLCWIAWHHPQMPWDGSELWCGDMDDGGELGTVRKLAGGATEAIFQPAWSPAGELHFVSDASGWWNLYRHHKGGNQPLFPVEAEFATPLWSLGMSTYGFVDDRHIATLFTQSGAWHLGVLDTASGRMAMKATPFSWMGALSCSADGDILFIGASATSVGDVALVSGGGESLVQLTESTPAIDRATISIPQPLSYPSAGGEMANGFYYPPANSQHRGPDGDKPPLIVMCHGGPTGANYGVLSYKVQYWTSRGFALLDVNYRGSTGYGRRYREKLNGNWGVVDVEDAAAGVAHLVGQGLVDPAKTIIRGSSAGGYTVLAALAFSDAFTAGASLYGIGDLEALARDTHKFESRYLDTLVGPYPATQDTYRLRSPIHHQDRLHCPVIFLQGLEDKVVPPNQAEAMVNALKSKGIPVAYITFADEGHGFRKAANIQAALAAELAFYRRVLAIPSAETLPEIEIHNL